ncbi:MAG: cyclic nucleotide-binding domain-containing protein [Gammaproteobacteria bacterium]|nr:cyclic nucleotide-binding domain-containing protein [Gammaproteobacteria bacterium]
MMTDLFDRIYLLKQSLIFSKVFTDDLRFIAESLYEEIFYKGDHIFELNDQGNEMFIITSGKVGISLSDNEKHTITELHTGDCFGEMNLLDGLPRSATAHALEDTHLLCLNKSNLRGLILSYPEISLGILNSLSLKLRNTNHHTLSSSLKQNSV